MEKVVINNNEIEFDEESALYQLYIALYNGVTAANDSSVKVPQPGDYEEGEAYTNAIKEYTDNLIKNSAYLYANSITSALGYNEGGGGGGGAPFLNKNGDSMNGKLNALHGFAAGDNNATIFSVSIDEDGGKFADVFGNLNVSGDISVDGDIKLLDKAIFFNGNKVLYLTEDGFAIDKDNVSVTGNLSLGGEFSVGGISIKDGGIFNGNYEYYHSGNANNDTVDWKMNNGSVAGDLTVSGNVDIDGHITSKGGFEFYANGNKILFSDSLIEGDSTVDYIRSSVGLDLINNGKLMIDGSPVVYSGGNGSDYVVIASDGKTLHLGSSREDKIELHSDIYNYSGEECIVSSNGDGFFHNSFKAGCGNMLYDDVLSTFFNSSEHYGIRVRNEVRFIEDISDSGVYLKGSDGVFYVYGKLSDSSKHGDISFVELNLPVDADTTTAMQLGTDAEYILASKPIVSNAFYVKSDTYKTHLADNYLFFNEGAFIEGMSDGIFYNGNSYFASNLSSKEYSSGFAGKGWSIKKDTASGLVGATFDDLTIRRKMRVYELEVQKTYGTNGALWVSDSCSGDEVREL